MLALYLICLSVRNIVQPKILGESMGISALASLVFIWLGFKLYGFIGMLIMPVIATVLYKLYDIGIFDWFFLSHKKVTEEKYLGWYGKQLLAVLQDASEENEALQVKIC
jgi:predicted PurR-regulated permease PerM